jgi:pyruvate dehydrogenase E1 component
VDQKLAQIPADPAARERRRRQVVAGAYVLRAIDAPELSLVTMGALVPEALAAAERLAGQGVRAEVICVTSAGLLFEALQSRQGQGDAPSWILDQVFPAERAAPMVTVLDGHPHTLSFLAGINRVTSRNLGVSRFGQAGDLASVYRYHGIDADAIVRAALDLRS